MTRSRAMNKTAICSHYSPFRAVRGFSTDLLSIASCCRIDPANSRREPALSGHPPNTTAIPTAAGSSQRWVNTRGHLISMTVRNGPAPFPPGIASARVNREMAMRIIRMAMVVVVGLFVAQGYAHADSQKCVELREALERYEGGKESWLNASSDARSFSTDARVLPIIKKLAKRREELQEERALQALMNLKSILSSMDVAKDWKIPNYEGIAN